MRLPGAFHDSGIPTWYAPHGIAAFGNRVFVSYAYRAPVNGNDAPHGGYVDEFDLTGRLITRVGAKDELDEPWGIALAPAAFGRYGGDLLVANFGSGRINAYAREGAGWTFRGRLPVKVPGVWGIAFGAGGASGRPTTLFYAAGSASLARRDRGGRRRCVRARSSVPSEPKKRARRARPAGRPSARLASGSSISWIAHRRGQDAELPAVLADRREGWVCERRGLEIVEPDHRDVPSRARARLPGLPGGPRAPSGPTRPRSPSGARRERAMHTLRGSRKPTRNRPAGGTPQGPSNPSRSVSLRNAFSRSTPATVFWAPATCAIRRWPSTCRCARARRTPSAWSEPT